MIESGNTYKDFNNEQDMEMKFDADKFPSIMETSMNIASAAFDLNLDPLPPMGLKSKGCYIMEAITDEQGLIIGKKYKVEIFEDHTFYIYCEDNESIDKYVNSTIGNFFETIDITKIQKLKKTSFFD